MKTPDELRAAIAMLSPSLTCDVPDELKAAVLSQVAVLEWAMELRTDAAERFGALLRDLAEMAAEVEEGTR